MARAAAGPSDLHMAQRCVSGDRVAQRELFRRERNRVHATLYRVLGSNGDMDDLLQEAFIEVFRSLASFRGDALLATWIDRITVRVAYAYLTRRRPGMIHLEAVPDLVNNDASAEQRALAREAGRRLYEVLNHLEARQRIVFTLHLIDGRSLKDIAEAMSATLVATKTRLWRARRFVEKRALRDPLLSNFLEREVR